MRRMPRIVSLAVLLLLIAGLGMTFFRVVAPFLMPLFLAGMTTIVCQPVFRYFLMRLKNHVYWAAGATTAVILTAIMVPLAVGILVASLQLYTFAVNVSDDSEWRGVLHSAGEQSNSLFEQAVEFGNQFLPKDQQRDPERVAEELASWIRTTFRSVGDRSLGRAAGTTLGVLAGTASWLFAAGIAVLIYGVAVYYFFADGTTLLQAAEKLIPVHAEYQQELLAEFAKVVRSVVVATFLAAIAQGFATTAALWFFGFGHIFVMFALSTIAALIPMAGTWLVWVPCSALLFVNGHWIQALLLAIYGAAFVGFLDNAIRTYVLNTDTKLHPLLAFISVLGGLQVMGLWGVFIGPIVASCLHALVKIFNHELLELSREHFDRPPESTEVSARHRSGQSETKTNLPLPDAAAPSPPSEKTPQPPEAE